jgi:hypothetical protein
MFRLAERDHGLSLRALHLETQIPISTLRDWKAGAAMPAWALFRLPIPIELKSLIGEPYGQHIGYDETPDGDLAQLECDASGVVHEIAKAKRDGVITPRERASIADAVRRMVPVARAVAA